MFNFLKIWKWKIFHRKTKPTDTDKPQAPKPPSKVKLYPARNLALVTSESNLTLVPCKVHDDHYITVRKKKIKLMEDRPAHVLTLPLHQIWPTRLGRRLGPRFQRYNVYTVQETGEITHDPHPDKLTEEMKQRFEKMLMLMGKFAEADAGAVIYEGIKGPRKWWDYIPYIAITVIVLMFLFAFQIQPNL